MHNFVGITPSRKSSEKTNFTICLGPLFNITKKNTLIEFVEMHKILEVQKIAVYDYNISAHVLEQLKKLYIKSGMVDIFPWKLPVQGKDVSIKVNLGC